MKQLKVFVACEHSGVLRDCLADMGYFVRSCDLLVGSGRHLDKHIVGDALDVLNWYRWDVLFCFPPCTYLCNSGVRWLKGDPVRMRCMIRACNFFNKFLECKIPVKVVENPIQHCYARRKIRKYDQIIHPWQHGHGETKSTCLWVEGLSPLEPTKIVVGRVPRVHFMSPGSDRSRKRSLTLPDIGVAMANWLREL